MVFRTVVVGALLVGACIKPSSHLCGDGTVCPADTTCDLERALCIAPGQLEACIGLDELTDCQYGDVVGQCYLGACMTATCGDGRVGPGEACDDGNFDSGDGCRNDCRSKEICGNGLLDEDEACDCGETERAPECASVNSLTSVAATCKPDCSLRCGDNVIQPGELCDGLPPAGESCLDYGYDLGRLGCSTICTPGFASCEQFGWINVSTGLVNPRTNAVWGADANNVFAVTDFDGVIKWDGTTWTKMTLPSPVSYLYGIWGSSASNVYAVGNGGSIFHFDGATWTSVPSNTTAPLYAVHGTATSITAVGGSLGKAVVTTSTNGSAFVATDHTASDLGALRAVVVDGTTATAVGDHSTVCYRATTTWSCTSFNGFYGNFTSLVLRQTTYYAGTEQGLFSFASDPTQMGDITELQVRIFGPVASLAVNGNDLIVGGQRIFHNDGTAWYQLSDGAVQNAGLWIAALDNIWAVGKLGVRNFRGTTWASVRTNAAQTLVVDAGPPGAYIAGPFTLQKFDQGEWSAALVVDDFVSVSVGTDLVVVLERNGKVAFSGDAPFDVFTMADNTDQPSIFTDVWTKDKAQDTFALALAIAQDPKVFRRRLVGAPTQWTPVGTSPTVQLNAIYGFADNDVFVAGSSGEIHHWNGSAWTKQATPVVFELRDLWGSAPNDMWAVGQMGAILHYNGTTWTQHDSGTFSTLEGIWGTGPDDVFAVGGDTLLHWDGTVWSPMRDSTDEQLSSVAGHSAFTHFAGTGGTADTLVRY